jgi:peptidoglycan/xylan/chitin deacetylase (PgdA/CDA1 family)
MNDGRLAILAYHKVGEDPRGGPPGFMYVPGEVFEAQLRWFGERRWGFVSLDEVLKGRLAGDCVLVTFDDGYRRTLTEALPVMRRVGAPGVVFVPTGFVGGVNGFDEGVEPVEEVCSWDELAELEAAGVSVESHGVGHRWMSGLDGAARIGEVVSSKRVIEGRLGKTVRAFSYPYGDDGSGDGGGDAGAAERVLRDAGYEAGCLYGGGPMKLPVADRFRLERVAMGPDTDLAREVGER